MNRKYWIAIFVAFAIFCVVGWGRIYYEVKELSERFLAVEIRDRIKPKVIYKTKIVRVPVETHIIETPMVFNSKVVEKVNIQKNWINFEIDERLRIRDKVRLNP